MKDRGSAHAELYDLVADIGESRDVAAANPDIVKQLTALAEALPLPAAPYDERIRRSKRK